MLVEQLNQEDDRTEHYDNEDEVLHRQGEQNENPVPDPRMLRAAVGGAEAAEQFLDAVQHDNGQDNEAAEENIGMEVYRDEENESNHEENEQEIPQHEQGDPNEEDIHIEHQDAAQGPGPHDELKKTIRIERFTSPITAQVMASPAEALLMALDMAEQNQLTFKAFVDSVKLLNCLFSEPVIPNTVYMLDKLLHSSAGIQRHFYCSNCSFSFGQRDSTVEPTLTCPEPKCKHLNKISDLTKATYLVVFPLQPQIELLLKNKEVREALRSPKEILEGRNPNEFSDIYDGESYKDFANSLTEDEDNVTVISLTGNTDGTPLFKSSKYSIWPFFASINELPPAMRMKNLLLAGLWFGNKKPPMDLYLEPVVDHLIKLSEGFTTELDNPAIEVLIKVFMIGICVDSGARGAVQGINTYSGYYSCNWCEIPGDYLNKVVFPFPEIPPKKRTDENVKEYARECLRNPQLSYVYGVQFLSPLAGLPKFNLVNGMVFDYAHNILFGISRTILDEWLTNTARGCYIGSPDDLSELDSKMMKITPPIEVRRAVRKMSDRAHWNMREFENWTLTYSIPVLTDILPLKYLQHWCYLVQVLFLLSRRKITREDIETAHKLALRFGRDAEYLYGLPFMTYNIHIFCHHIAENCVRWGPLWAINTFSFESGNKDLKGLIHAQHGVPHQIHRALSYRQASSILKINCGSHRTEAYKGNIASKVNKMTRYNPVDECALIGTSQRFAPSEEEKYVLEHCEFNIDLSNCMSFKKIVVGKCVYVTSDLAHNTKFNNECAITNDNKIIILKKIILDKSTDKVYVLYNEMSTEPFLRMPQGVRIAPHDHCIRVETLMGRRLSLISVTKLKSVCAVTNLNDKVYVTEFPNVFNVF
ncbi:Titin [Frankliniella fusca]|uniref:Titin n=1 Tax=Frankliniella fusca TaxID=407009 RepID=A0AAE1L6I1_9NEOP|nr:Titin [Frankliniella fusca]